MAKEADILGEEPVGHTPSGEPIYPAEDSEEEIFGPSKKLPYSEQARQVKALEKIDKESQAERKQRVKEERGLPRQHPVLLRAIGPQGEQPSHQLRFPDLIFRGVQRVLGDIKVPNISEFKPKAG